MLILVANEKGGTGKTTVSINLACMCACVGREVLLIDTDPQASASAWAAVRHEAAVSPAVTCVAKTGKVGHDIARLGEKYEVVIVDAGGRDSLEMRQAMAVCDLTIMPTRPSQFDVWSLNRMAHLVVAVAEQTGESVHAVALINGASANPMIRETGEVRATLDEYLDVFPTLETTITDRIAFRKSAREGLGVVEMPGLDPKAYTEMASLYREIFHEAYAAQDQR